MSGEMWGLAIALSSSILAIVIWSIRQEGRINAHDQKFEDMEKLLAERHTVVVRTMDGMDKKVDFLTDYMIFQGKKDGSPNRPEHG